MDPLMATIQLFALSFVPKGWMLCDGRLLSIAQYSALFSLLGTSFGGDGVQTFALPKLNPLAAEGTTFTCRYCIAVEGVYPSRAD